MSVTYSFAAPCSLINTSGTNDTTLQHATCTLNDICSTASISSLIDTPEFQVVSQQHHHHLGFQSAASVFMMGLQSYQPEMTPKSRKHKTPGLQTAEDIKKQSKYYESAVRSRSFNESWTKEFPWVQEFLLLSIIFFVPFSTILRLNRDYPVGTGGGKQSSQRKSPPNPKSLVTFSHASGGVRTQTAAQ